MQYCVSYIKLYLFCALYPMVVNHDLNRQRHYCVNGNINKIIEMNALDTPWFKFNYKAIEMKVYIRVGYEYESILQYIRVIS